MDNDFFLLAWPAHARNPESLWSGWTSVFLSYQTDKKKDEKKVEDKDKEDEKPAEKKQITKACAVSGKLSRCDQVGCSHTPSGAYYSCLCRLHAELSFVGSPANPERLR